MQQEGAYEAAALLVIFSSAGPMQPKRKATAYRSTQGVPICVLSPGAGPKGTLQTVQLRSKKANCTLL